jgi:hypothetical protein
VSRARSGAIALTAAALLSVASVAAAQNPPPLPVRPPSPPQADTVRADTTQRDTTEAKPAAPTSVPVLPYETPPGPLPPGSRLTFTRDSVLWTSAYTLAELLAEVPGVYAARTGFVGQPAPVMYGGRGPAGIEIYWDGLPLVPVGADSVTVDPGRISLFGIGRVEVERLPGLLRVYLVSERSAQLGSKSLLRIVSGSFKTGGYAGLFQYRTAGGVGLDLLADYWGTQGSLSPQRNAEWFDLRLKAEWTPSPLLAASVQVRRLTFSRGATGTAPAPFIPPRGDIRTEALVRVIASSRPDREGLSLEAGLQTTAWHADSGKADTVVGARAVHRAFLGVRAAGRRATADLLASVGDRYTPASAMLRAGWVPIPWLVLSTDGTWARYDGGRTSLRGHAAVGLFWRSLSLVGEGTLADAVAAPGLPGDTAEATADFAARAGLASRRLTIHAGVERRDAFAEPAAPTASSIGALPPSPAATSGVGDLTVRLGALALSGWIARAVSGTGAAFDPPSHVRGAITFRSKFWRTFRSGAFDLKAQVSLESWTAGTAGLDASGAPIPLPAATLSEAYLQIELVHFSAFYSLKNAFGSLEGYVPDFAYPRVIQTFGVKWSFQN